MNLHPHVVQRAGEVADNQLIWALVSILPDATCDGLSANGKDFVHLDEGCTTIHARVKSPGGRWCRKATMKVDDPSTTWIESSG
ncbi:hypothetical protein AN958_06845 [Leucoagaricus sp. SymC.cos]|nr:hypothetical protein AN958_06845 [Leucoagaricus sp. SymC.cos]